MSIRTLRCTNGEDCYADECIQNGACMHEEEHCQTQPQPTEGGSREKFTPGPWIALPETIDTQGFVIQVIQSQETKSVVGEVYGGTTLSEPSANARLIASAPDMDAELQRLREEIHGQREELARFIISHGSSTGHGDTSHDLLTEFGRFLDERRTERKTLRASHAKLLKALEEDTCDDPLCAGCEQNKKLIDRARELTKG